MNKNKNKGVVPKPKNDTINIMAFPPMLVEDGHDLRFMEAKDRQGNRALLVTIQTRTRDIRLWRQLTEGEAVCLLSWLKERDFDPSKE